METSFPSRFSLIVQVDFHGLHELAYKISEVIWYLFSNITFNIANNLSILQQLVRSLGAESAYILSMAGRFAALFARQAEAYARYRPKYQASLFETIARYAAAHGTGRYHQAADIACGSGQATVDIAKTYSRVIGVDASAEQVAKAPPAANISFALGTAEATGLPDASCDLVTVAQALHWFDLPSFYAEAARVLKPRGTLAIWTYAVGQPSLPGGDARTNAALAAAFMRTYEGKLGSYWDARRRLVDALYAGMEPPSSDGAAAASGCDGSSSSASKSMWQHVARHLPVMHVDMPVSALCSYVTTWSAYATYMTATSAVPGTGDDPAMALQHDLLAAIKSGGSEGESGGPGASSAAVSLDEATIAAEARAAESISVRMTWPMALILATRA